MNSIDEDLTVIQHLNLFVKLSGIPKDIRVQAINEIVEACLLQGFENTKPEGMSRGQIRRLTPAMALVGRPELVILDHPFECVDPLTKRKLMKTIMSFTENSTLFMATNDIEVAEFICDRIAIMNKGKFVAIGSVGELIKTHGRGYAV